MRSWWYRCCLLCSCWNAGLRFWIILRVMSWGKEFIIGEDTGVVGVQCRTLGTFESSVNCYTFTPRCRKQLSEIRFVDGYMYRMIMYTYRGFLMIISIQWYVYLYQEVVRGGMCDGRQGISVSCRQ